MIVVFPELLSYTRGGRREGWMIAGFMARAEIDGFRHYRIAYLRPKEKKIVYVMESEGGGGGVRFRGRGKRKNARRYPEYLITFT